MRSAWCDPAQRATIISELESRGISFQQLAEATGRPDDDPFDLLIHVAFNAPLRSRRERAEYARLTTCPISCKILIFNIRYFQMRRDPQENARALYQTAAAQGGYFTAAQASQAGYAYSQQHFHIVRGNWLKVGRGLFRLRDFPPGEREDLIRWSLWSRDQADVPQAVVSHDTALAVHELSDVMPARIHLTVPKGFRKRVPPDCVLHTASLSSGEVEARPGYRVTTPLRTLLDVAASPLSQEHLNRAVRDALERGLVRRYRLETAPCSTTARRRLDQALAALPVEEMAT